MGLQDHPAQHDRALHDPLTCLEYTIMSETHDELPTYAEKYPDEVPVNPTPEYKVGYKRPPREHQFKKDQSGNPSGKPKKRPDIRKNLYEDIDRAMQKRICVDGERMTKWQAFIKALVDAAANGDRHARKELLEIMADTKRWASSAGVTFILEDSQ